MRILLLTDSLGCPREEISVKDTWTERLMDSYKGSGAVFYTYCCYGLSVKDIPMAYINFLKPDVIICEIGIVDACRRALTEKEEFILSRIPLISRLIRSFCSRNHFLLTKIRQIHRCREGKFQAMLERMAKESDAYIYLVEIAPPGDFLVKHTCHAAEDIQAYNRALDRVADLENVELLQPFSKNRNLDCNEYLLAADGHHLNLAGQELVFSCVGKALSSKGCSRQIRKGKGLADEGSAYQ